MFRLSPLFDGLDFKDPNSDENILVPFVGLISSFPTDAAIPFEFVNGSFSEENEAAFDRLCWLIVL